MKSAPGSYVLFLRLPEEKRITVGRLGAISFPAGSYAYVGSALNGWEARLARHLGGGGRRHWHIDYLRAEAQVDGAIVVESSMRLECRINKAISEISRAIVSGFGSSDCGCSTHLHWLTDAASDNHPRSHTSNQSVLRIVLELVETLGLNRHWAIYHLDSECGREIYVQSEH
jgi:Uri superfamily endonuclease